MTGPDVWENAIEVDTSEYVHVTETTEGVYVFYTEVESAYIRTDTVVDIPSHR